MSLQSCGSRRQQVSSGTCLERSTAPSSCTAATPNRSLFWLFACESPRQMQRASPCRTQSNKTNLQFCPRYVEDYSQQTLYLGFPLVAFGVACELQASSSKRTRNTLSIAAATSLAITIRRPPLSVSPLVTSVHVRLMCTMLLRRHRNCHVFMFCISFSVRIHSLCLLPHIRLSLARHVSLFHDRVPLPVQLAD
jgi:hypothetical protein